MKQQNGQLVALVASVAVAAVAIGGVLAYRQSPQQGGTAAAPLPAQTPPSTPSTTPSTTPTPTASGTPSSRPTPSGVPSKTPSSSTPPPITGPTTIDLVVSKLPEGREPQVPYLVGREVRGGAGRRAKVPGTANISVVGRLDPYVLALVSTEDGTELLRFDGYSKDVRRTPGVSSLVTTADQSAAAYAVAGISSRGSATQGAVVYAETNGSVRSLKVPDGWDVQVLSYANGKVYYRAGESLSGAWKLYAWTPGTAKAALLKVPSPTAVSADGRIAASASLVNDSGSCSSIAEIATGKQLWRTCDNWIDGFTPDGATALGWPAYGDGYCSGEQAAIDARNGRLLHEWKGCFLGMGVEDDQHVLLVAVASGRGTDAAKSAIIRCTITTGACELATPITADPLEIGR